MTDKLIFKIVLPDEWKAAEQARIYYGSAHDKSDGFLHFSTASQLQETLRLYYADADAVMIVAVNAARLGDTLKWEHSPSRGEDFPHLFGPLLLTYEPIEQATVMATLYKPRMGPVSGLQEWLSYLQTRCESAWPKDGQDFK